MGISSIGQKTAFPIPKAQTKKGKEIKMSEAEKEKLYDTIAEMAKKDAKEGVYMGEDFLKLRKEYVAQVSPDRAQAIAQASRFTEIPIPSSEEIDVFLSMLMHLPYKLNENFVSLANTGHIYDENGDAIVASHWGGGFSAVSTPAENARHDEVKFVYYDAYKEARQKMKAETVKNMSGSMFNEKV